MLASTSDWWLLLRGLAALNLLAWGLVAWLSWRGRARWPADAWATRRWLLLLSAGYVLGCGWRSLLPVYDIQRLVLVDSVLSSVIVGRSVATVAELCFAAQWALLLHEVSRVVGSRAGRAVAHVVLPLIACAELFSWHAVLTTSNLGHVVEESLWGSCAALLVVSLLMVWPQVERDRRPLLALWCAGGVAYVAYMFGVDVPMYWARWVADEAQGRSYLGLAQGLEDAAMRRVVSHDWDHWKSEITWMTLYFSAAVWLSIGMVLVPRFRATPAAPPAAPATGRARTA
jgi:hypothetical protein